MKFIAQTLAVAVLSFALQSFFPWWSLAVAGFIVGLVAGRSGWISFFSGFLGVGLLWIGMTLYLDLSTNSILSSKVAQLFPTKTTPLLFLFTCLVGGLVGGFSTLTGSLITYRKKPRW